MEPYGNIQPAGASPIKLPSPGAGSGNGGLLGALGAISGQRAILRLHGAQIAHEAEQNQLAHERNLEIIDRLHRAGMSLDQAKYAHKETMEGIRGQNALEMQHLVGKQTLEKDAQDAVIKQSHVTQEHDLGVEKASREAAIRISEANAAADRERNKAREDAANTRTDRAHRTSEAIRLAKAVAPGSSLSITEGGNVTNLVTKPKRVKPVAAPATEGKPAEEKPAEEKPKGKPRGKGTSRPKVDAKAAEAYND